MGDVWSLLFRAVLIYVALGVGIIGGSVIASVTLWVTGYCG